jgi:NNP family nitrate/nitrite transporter-like MFS transporter
MVPIVFAIRASGDDGARARKAAAALGLISAIGAYGGFLIPQALNVSFQASGGYVAAFLGFVAFYVVLLAVTYLVYVRSGQLREHRV